EREKIIRFVERHAEKFNANILRAINSIQTIKSLDYPDEDAVTEPGWGPELLESMLVIIREFVTSCFKESKESFDMLLSIFIVDCQFLTCLRTEKEKCWQIATNILEDIDLRIATMEIYESLNEIITLLLKINSLRVIFGSDSTQI
ncbi:MAG: hypothetical protein MHMPM18_005030, partial [Marteilia pararefringens]